MGIETYFPDPRCARNESSTAGLLLRNLLQYGNPKIPDEWATASVAMLFKKGDPADANNYRPICLQSIAYKLFASLLKQRRLDAGVETRLWKSQFGFRRGHRTEDAIFVALRKKIEQACAQRNGRIRLLALDWKKAFDGINMESLLDSLRRFGIPDFCRQMIRNMMQHRRFYVEDQGVKSNLKAQNSGIWQGCTLSPLLFIIMMTVLMHDAISNLSNPAQLAVWKHSSLPRFRKIEIYKALIESKLMYSLSCLCLSSADRRRLDGFQNRRLRSILGIPPAFISRVSNMEVLRTASYISATDMLLKRQLILFGKALRSPFDHPFYVCAFIPASLQRATSACVSRVGRPRRERVTHVRDKAFQFFEGHYEIARLVQNPHVWHRTVCQLLPVHAPPGV